jgi:hypothetical protein
MLYACGISTGCKISTIFVRRAGKGETTVNRGDRGADGTARQSKPPATRPVSASPMNAARQAVGNAPGLGKPPRRAARRGAGTVQRPPRSAPGLGKRPRDAHGRARARSRERSRRKRVGSRYASAPAPWWSRAGAGWRGDGTGRLGGPAEGGAHQYDDSPSCPDNSPSVNRPASQGKHPGQLSLGGGLRSNKPACLGRDRTVVPL